MPSLCQQTTNKQDMNKGTKNKTIQHRQQTKKRTGQEAQVRLPFSIILANNKKPQKIEINDPYTLPPFNVQTPTHPFSSSAIIFFPITVIRLYISSVSTKLFNT
jgi:hypothetical protein